MSAPRIGVVGIHGYGSSHVRRALELQRQGRAVLAAVADPAPPVPGALPDDVLHAPDADAMLAAGDLDVVAIATPIHTHAAIATSALEVGADVLLEKPPTATLDEFRALVARADARGALVQVGFQSLGSTAIPAVRARIAAGGIGDVLRYGASGAWVRDDRYYARAAWAGRRRMDGRIVADGALTNPLAHATATALAIAGAQGEDDIRSLDLELLHANDIEADDTSVARFGLADGLALTTAVTLCAAESEEPYVEIVGTAATLRLFYTLDVVQIDRRDRRPPATQAFERTPLLDDLLDARAAQREPLSPLAAAGGFMRLVEGVMTAPDPRPIAPEHWREVVDEEGRHRVVAGVEEALHVALREQAIFSEVGAPFIC